MQSGTIDNVLTLNMYVPACDTGRLTTSRKMTLPSDSHWIWFYNNIKVIRVQYSMYIKIRFQWIGTQYTL